MERIEVAAGLLRSQGKYITFILPQINNNDLNLTYHTPKLGSVRRRHFGDIFTTTPD